MEEFYVTKEKKGVYQKYSNVFDSSSFGRYGIRQSV